MAMHLGQPSAVVIRILSVFYKTAGVSMEYHPTRYQGMVVRRRMYDVDVCSHCP